jgi:hypothetical protein
MKEAVMATIIAGRLEQQSAVEDTMEELMRDGFSRERIASFYVNPPGQHDAYPIGGDHAVSQGAHETGKGAEAGIAAGAVAGLAAAPFLGPLGPVTGGLLGAHVGGLVGSLSKMKERGETGEHGEDADNVAPLRRAGLMVAVAVGGDGEADRAVRILHTLGVAQIERAEGTIENGDWIDFDPVSPPMLLQLAPDQSSADAPHRRI